MPRLAFRSTPLLNNNFHYVRAFSTTRTSRQNSASQPAISIENAAIFRYGPASTPIFRNLTLHIGESQNWAIVGPLGSGKTSLCESLIGRHRSDPPDAIKYPFIERLAKEDSDYRPKSLWPQDLIRHVSFKEESGLFDFGSHYYQQRFERVEEWRDITLRKYLEHGLQYAIDEVGGISEARALQIKVLAEMVGLERLLDLSFMKLSNGQMRRARIAKALLSAPRMLLVDEPFMGLDVDSRRDIAELLGQVASGSPCQVMLFLRPQDELPEWVTHVLQLSRDRTTTWKGAREDWDRIALANHHDSVPIRQRLLERTNRAEASEKNSRDKIIELRNVSVSFGEEPILDNVSWTVRKGERWALMGPNGSGKSTLLSLLLGDNPQAYSNDISLFGRRRGTGESIWDIKSHTGLSSPELHMSFTKPLTCWEVVASGFFDVPSLVRSVSSDQRKTIDELLTDFQVQDLANRPFKQMSTAEQRLILLIRALVKTPRLLVLDEPFQGLDVEAVENAKRWLDNNLEDDQTLIFVTHHEEEIPNSVDRLIRLEDGTVVDLNMT